MGIADYQRLLHRQRCDLQDARLIFSIDDRACNDAALGEILCGELDQPVFRDGAFDGVHWHAAPAESVEKKMFGGKGR